MIHKRIQIIILDGDEKWIKATLAQGLPEGKTKVGPERFIFIETIESDVLPINKEKKNENGNNNIEC